MVFYADTNNENNNLPTEKYRPTIEDILSESKYLLDIDILNFNYYLFEGDLEKLQPDEFQLVLNDLIEKFIEVINENYLNIEIRNILQKNELEQKIFLKKFILFFMQILPYEILKPILKNPDQLRELHSNELYDTDSSMIPEEQFSTPTETMLYRIFDTDNENIYKIKDFINIEIDKKIKKMGNFINIIDEIMEVSKKNTLEDSRDIFETHINTQNAYYRIYKDVLQNTDLEKLVNLFRKYIEKDYLNIIN
jgi:hypothetical protein